jgi:LPXTG-motif cell wall-anchored protein
MQVAKIWLDTGFENNRPNQIEAQLLRNGEVYDTQTLTKDNNWRYTWYDLDGQYIWKVLEKEVPKGYTLSLETEGYRAIMTNKIVPENSSSSDNTSSTETPEDPTTSTNQETPTTSTDSTTQDTPSTTEQPTNSATETTTEESTTTKKTSSGNKSSSSTSSNRTSTSGGSTTYTKASQKLPQTGQVWWPVPILGIAGLLCIILGVLRRDKK